jgi:hypothetical protein
MSYQKILTEQYKTEFETVISKQYFQQLLKIFDCVLEFDSPQQTGIKETVSKLIEDAFEPTQIGAVANLKLLATEIEPFLKKIVIILESSIDNVAKNKTNDVGFPELLAHLRINQDFANNTHRYIRNPQAHNSEKLPLKQYYTDLQDVLFTYLFTVHTKYEALYAKLQAEHIFEDYYKVVMQDYENRKAAFLDLEVKEYIELMGTEVIEQGKNMQKAEIDKVTVLYDRIPEKQMMLLGTAGMGKTTTLLFLARTMAAHNLDRNRKNKKAIPVYITLAAFDKEEQRIEEEIARKTDRSVEFVENYLKEGKFAVFIDGFNELMDKISTKFERSIQIFIDRYQNTKTVIASRPTAYENIAFKQAGNADLQSRKPIRAFLIKEMKDDMIEQFVKKNYTKPEDAKNLLAKIRENKKLEQMLGNPLYLFELIQIYDPEKQIPPSTNALTGKFLESKYKREKSRNTEFKRDIFHETMILYAQTVYLEIGEDNPHVAQETAWKIVTKELAEHKISVKTFFEWALSLHILFKEKEKSEKEKYFFTHQSYFSYYYSIEQ